MRKYCKQYCNSKCKKDYITTEIQQELSYRYRCDHLGYECQSNSCDVRETVSQKIASSHECNSNIFSKYAIILVRDIFTWYDDACKYLNFIYVHCTISVNKIKTRTKSRAFGLDSSFSNWDIDKTFNFFSYNKI